jgi:signal transduction histidine kinase/HAMP domain-containing protein
MSIELTLLSSDIHIVPPQGLTGWLGWVLLLGLLIVLMWRFRRYNKRFNNQRWGIFALLLVLVPLTSLLMVIRLPADETLLSLELPLESTGPALVVFAALPVFLGAGLLGPTSAAVLGVASGLILGLLDTHNPFTMLEMGFLGVLLGAALNQRYWSSVFRALHHPIVSALLFALIYPPIFIFNSLLASTGSLAIRLDYALTNLPYFWLAIGIELIVAGVFAEVVAAALPIMWGNPGTLQVSPYELTLQRRVLVSMLPLAILLLLALIIGDWVIVGNAAREMLKNQMANAARMSADSVPYFTGSGQNLIMQLSQNSVWHQGTLEEQADLIQQSLRSVPFFRQLYLLDSLGNPVMGYPTKEISEPAPTQEEIMGIELALNGVPIQNYTISPAQGGTTAQVSFIAAIFDVQSQIKGILVGRTDLGSNPFTLPILTSLNSATGEEGQGMLLDGNRRILYNSQGTGVMEIYNGPSFDEPMFYIEKAPDGRNYLVYYQPARGNTWSVIISVPAQQAQELALSIATPLLVMLMLLFLAAGILISFTLNRVTLSIKYLAREADRISSGYLDNPLVIGGEDEVGQLGRALEQMRTSLKTRLDELNQLLQVSQGAAASLEMDQAVGPVLKAALSTGACTARVVLSSTVIAEGEENSSNKRHFGSGPCTTLYDNVDDQILTLSRQQDRIMLTNLGRIRLLTFSPGVKHPEAILALAMRHENTFYGTMWLAFDTPHQFTNEEVRFLTTLAGLAAMAAANTQLFLNAEIGRQRLASILDSTPDPVLVTDQKNRLLLANPAAWQLLNIGAEVGEGQPVSQVIQRPELVRLLSTIVEDKLSAEVPFPDGKVYLAMASSVYAEGQRAGRICVLRDITYFKEVDTLKSEFVATVSHDLRSPLMMMRGYITMLEMVGELNDQQTGYMRKIMKGVEDMTRLVNNLLDLGRIEAGVDLNLEMIVVSELLGRVIGSMQLQAAQKHLQLTTELSPDTVPLVEADPRLLQQALTNLLDNAIKYTESGEAVTLRAYARENNIVFEVKDKGIGIAPVDQSRLFEKFFRGAQREAMKNQGTGLGLAIVKSIAERHNGRVWFESQLGKGSTFSLEIPLRQPRKEKQS